MTVTYTIKGEVYNETRAVSLYAEYDAIITAIAAEIHPKQKGLLKAKADKAWERFSSSCPFVTVVDGIPVIPSPAEPIV